MAYNPQRTRNMYVSGQEKPFKLSRSRIDNFFKCPCCFYMDRKLGVEPRLGLRF